MNQTTPIHTSKKIMRISVIGIRPADEVMLKGYLRILLRLEAELEWVSANNPIVDLFMINHEFRSADSITRLLASQPTSAVLYINRSEREVGQLVDNLLTLPIKELDALNQWLFSHVAVLSSLTTRPTTSVAQQQTPQNITDIVANRAKQQQITNTLTQIKESANPKAVSFARIITRLYKKEDSYLRLVDGAGNVLAYIHPSTQRVWAMSHNLHIQSSWQLQFDDFTDANTPKHGTDLAQWLWDCANQNLDDLVTLIHPNQSYHLSSWIKPKDDTDRHHILKIQTVLEKRPVTFKEIVELTQSPADVVKKTLIGLISAGLMTPNVYAQLMTTVDYPQIVDSVTVATTTTNTTTTNIPAPVASATTIDTNDDTSMKGFLSRLRRKLGI